MFHINEAAQQLEVTPKHLRVLERKGRISPARRDFNRRIYTAFDIALLRSMRVGSRPQRLKRAEQVVA